MPSQDNPYQLIVVGGGHAGTEAALAAARMGVQVLLLTHNLDTLGQMSCNPAIGGIGKGHLVKEIDAMGGLMARAADHSGIHFRILNASKGMAVRATRAQIDRMRYRQFVRHALDSQPGLYLLQQAVADLIVEGETVRGVQTEMGLSFYAPCVILTAGTFLNGRIHIGDVRHSGGRAAEAPTTTLAQRLAELSPRTGRLKTGTPPRIDGRTVDYSRCTLQPGDVPVPVFSYTGKAAHHPQQMPCYITSTNARTHAIIRAALPHSPLFNGEIGARGPRYCPSVEDKVVRFPDRETHSVFIEPEGLHSGEIYPNGISTSLPYAVQQDLVRSIRGFERAHITRPGYAIEYDFFDPRDLHPWLETRSVSGLFYAGQINGTTGYEEAAAQGFLAGLNAALRVCGAVPWYPRRDEAYIGVLADDLTTQGASEPYRMFTSRAEYRLLLREDNADLRLTEKAHALGLLDGSRWHHFCAKKEMLAATRRHLEETWVQPDTASAERLSRCLHRTLSRPHNLWHLLKHPGLTYTALSDCLSGMPTIPADLALQLETQARYDGYIIRQQSEIERARDSETTRMPDDLDYAQVRGLSNEVIESLQRHRPMTLGQASRLPGITPAAISLLRVHLKRHFGDSDSATRPSTLGHTAQISR